MSKSRKRNVDEIYDLKKQLKDKDDTIKALERKLANEEKHEKKVSKSTPKEPEVITIELDSCRACFKGKLEFHDLGFRKLAVCSQCKARQILK